MTDGPSPREMRRSSALRGVIIAALLAFYGFVMRQPAASFTVALLIAAAMQGAVLVARRVVPPQHFAQTSYVIELLVDAATVCLFALAVYGGILHAGYDV